MPTSGLTLRTLEEPYRSRAVPPGSPYYWSWLFAARAVREPLLGVYALAAEWRALTDTAVESSVAQIKLAWWRDELHRLAAGSARHPITGFLADLPGAAAGAAAPATTDSELGQLERVLDATAAQIAGVPLERAADLEPHAAALYGIPLRVASRLAGGGDEGAVPACTAALGAAEYLVRAIAERSRDARCGRVPFPVDELLAAGIDNDDLAAADPPPRLLIYLDVLRRRAAEYFAAAAALLPASERPAHRHLLVLAALGAKHLQERTGRRRDFRLSDLYNAWSTARRAAAGR